MRWPENHLPHTDSSLKLPITITRYEKLVAVNFAPRERYFTDCMSIFSRLPYDIHPFANKLKIKS